MRGTVAAMPKHLRAAMGLFTVLLLGFFGMTFRVDKPLVGWVFLAMAAFRFALWIRELQLRSRARPEGGADEAERS